MTRYWKVLDENGRSCHGGSFRYSLPRWDETEGWIPGEWTPAITNLEPCVSGYHVCRDGDLLDWLGPRIYACETRGAVVVADNKVVAESVRLTCPTPWADCAARLFAVECAADVLSLYESRRPNDSRCADALAVALRYAVGDATDADLAAARAAAWAAARAAAGDAARAAAGAAARAAAGAAAGDAAGDAARAAAGAVARAAAWDAAWDAAGAAAAARDAAWDAARDKQTANLLIWLGAPAAGEPNTETTDGD